MFKCILTFLLIVILIESNCFAQNNTQEKVTNKAKETITDGKNAIKEKSKSVLGGFLRTDRKEVNNVLFISARANTNGWTGGLGFGKKKNEHLWQLYSLTLSEIKHDKEEKIKPSGYEIKGYGKQLPYIYGKQNSFYTLNFGYSQQRLLLKGIIVPSVNISLVYGVDFALGILKPYYLKIKRTTNNSFTIDNEKYSVSNADTFLSNKNIYSRSAFGYGWKESKLVPGVNFRFGTQVDIGNSVVWIKALQLGVTIYLNTGNISIIATKPASLSYFNLFMRIEIGKLW